MRDRGHVPRGLLRGGVRGRESRAVRRVGPYRLHRLPAGVAGAPRPPTPPSARSRVRGECMHPTLKRRIDAPMRLRHPHRRQPRRETGRPGAGSLSARPDWDPTPGPTMPEIHVQVRWGTCTFRCLPRSRAHTRPPPREVLADHTRFEVDQRLVMSPESWGYPSIQMAQHSIHWSVGTRPAAPSSHPQLNDASMALHPRLPPMHPARANGRLTIFQRADRRTTSNDVCCLCSYGAPRRTTT